MEIIPILVNLTSQVNGAVGLIISLFAIVVVAWAGYKKVDVDERTSNSMVHERQIDSLINQIDLLSKELTLARNQLTEIHEQNINLMSHLRLANHRITELEVMLGARPL